MAQDIDLFEGLAASGFVPAESPVEGAHMFMGNPDADEMVQVSKTTLQKIQASLLKLNKDINNMIHTNNQRKRVLDELLGANGKAVALAVEVRSELIKTKRECDELLRKLQQVEGQQ